MLYIHDMWFGLENMLVSYADDATLLARIPSPNMRADVTESLNPLSFQDFFIANFRRNFSFFFFFFFFDAPWHTGFF